MQLIKFTKYVIKKSYLVLDYINISSLSKTNINTIYHSEV